MYTYMRIHLFALIFCFLFFCSYLHIGIQICTVLCGLFGFFIIVVYTVKIDGSNSVSISCLTNQHFKRVKCGSMFLMRETKGVHPIKWCFVWCMCLRVSFSCVCMLGYWCKLIFFNSGNFIYQFIIDKYAILNMLYWIALINDTLSLGFRLLFFSQTLMVAIVWLGSLSLCLWLYSPSWASSQTSCLIPRKYYSIKLRTLKLWLKLQNTYLHTFTFMCLWF